MALWIDRSSPDNIPFNLKKFLNSRVYILYIKYVTVHNVQLFALSTAVGPYPTFIIIRPTVKSSVKKWAVESESTARPTSRRRGTVVFRCWIMSDVVQSWFKLQIAWYICILILYLIKNATHINIHFIKCQYFCMHNTNNWYK
jgi:hypothetical protein